jgi:hypothetical protein
MTPPALDPNGSPAYDGPARSFGERFVGALKLDAHVYEEVEHDGSALGQAAAVVALAALAQGLGTAGAGGGLGGAIGAIVGGFLGWVVATAVIWLIGVKLMDHSSDYLELLRTTGFASAPGVLMALGILPLGPLRAVLGLAVFVLSVIAYVIAVRQALDIGTGRAVVVCLLANLAGALLVFFLLSLFGAPMPIAPGGAAVMP